VGECSNTGVHGANRLAGNSLAEALVFGRRAARAIAGQRTGKIKPMPRDIEFGEVDVDVDETWDSVRRLTSEAMGITRSPARLAELPSELEAPSRLPLTMDRGALELRAAAVLARLMARAALLRTESRGVHHREDHPEPEPEWAGVRLRLARTDLPEP
jgi:L-aspartate oxidase